MPPAAILKLPLQMAAVLEAQCQLPADVGDTGQGMGGMGECLCVIGVGGRQDEEKGGILMASVCLIINTLLLLKLL